MIYSIEQAIETVKLYHGNNNNGNITKRLFNENHIELSHQYMMSVIEKFEE